MTTEHPTGAVGPSNTRTTHEQKGRNRPNEHLLNKHVTDVACREWFALGLELQVNAAELNQIRQNFKNDVKGCCNEMFQLWLQSSTNASWNQLIQALKEVKLNHLAVEIENLIFPVEDSTHVSCDNAEEQLDVLTLKPEGKVIEPRKTENNLVTQDELGSVIENKKVKFITEHEAESFRKKTQILLVTANKFENEAVLSFLEPIEGDALLKYQYNWKIGFIKKQAMYIFGKFGAVNAAVHLMVKQGSSAAQDVVITASAYFGKNLDAIFAVGVACGVEGKSDLLDVLVSKSITCYNASRYGTTKDGKPEILNRDMTNLDTDPFIIGRFSTPPHWPIKDSPLVNRLSKPPQMHMGLILSGDYLVDNKDLKEQLLKNFAKDAKGIEMEGAGLYHEYAQNDCKIMIVKAVCDFGDGLKDKSYQPTAALLAAECLHHYLKEEDMPEALCGGKVPVDEADVHTRPTAPTNVRATVITPDSVEVTWDQSSGATGYAISYAATAIKDKRVTMTRGCSMSQILTDLKDDTEYTISVQGTTNDGNKDVESDKAYMSVKTSKHGGSESVPDS